MLLLDLLSLDSAPWLPLAGPQLDAFLSPADELFYGGGAGGGKTDLTIGLAATAHLRSIVFRREIAQLDGLENRSRQILNKYGRYNSQDMVWQFHTLETYRFLEFGGVQYADDWIKHQGIDHDLTEYDEICNFLRTQYTTLNIWNRSAIPGQRSRVVCTGNPPTTLEGEWVIEYWAPWLDDQHPNPAIPGELRWFTVLDGVDQELEHGQPFTFKGDLITPKSRTFIPARVDDNPFLIEAGYKARLQSLPEPLRSQMLEGKMLAGRIDDAFQCIPTAWIRAAQTRWLEFQDAKRKPGPLEVLGVDIARGGEDTTVIAPRHGRWFAPLTEYPGLNTPDGDIAARLVMTHHGGSARIHIDVEGVGSSPYDVLKKIQPTVPLRSGGKSNARDRSTILTFGNKRAEWWWKLREALEPGKGDDLMLPDDRQLLADLAAPRFHVEAGKIWIEKKEQIKKRIHRSTNRGDAVVYAHAGETLASGFEGFKPLNTARTERST